MSKASNYAKHSEAVRKTKPRLEFKDDWTYFGYVQVTDWGSLDLEMLKGNTLGPPQALELARWVLATFEEAEDDRPSQTDPPTD